METYILLIRWTQQGVENIKQSPGRLEEFRAALERAGAKLKDFYLVSGRYDMIAIVEAANYETIAGIALQVGSRGGVRTETLRAFPEAEYRKLISSLP